MYITLLLQMKFSQSIRGILHSLNITSEWNGIHRYHLLSLYVIISSIAVRPYADE